jgi:LPS sulfotransferase NodH
VRGYAICTEPRTGSIFLCKILESTGVLGRPHEYFDPAVPRNVLGIADYPIDPEEQVQLIPRLSATQNGVYGLKIFTRHFDYVQSTRWAERLPSLYFIHLERVDVLGQSISHLRASQTQQWTSGRAPQGEPTYDRAQINNEMIRILNAQNRWRYYLARNGAPYLHLLYENIVRFPQETAEAVGRLIGLAEQPRVDLDKVDINIQRDALSDEWRKQFIAESRNLGVFHLGFMSRSALSWRRSADRGAGADPAPMSRRARPQGGRLAPNAGLQAHACVSIGLQRGSVIMMPSASYHHSPEAAMLVGGLILAMRAAAPARTS